MVLERERRGRGDDLGVGRQGDRDRLGRARAQAHGVAVNRATLGHGGRAAALDDEQPGRLDRDDVVLHVERGADVVDAIRGDEAVLVARVERDRAGLLSPPR